MASRSASGGTVLASGIRTRERKERKLYSDDWALGDEEIEGHHTFNLEEKIKTDKFDLNFVKDMTDSEFNLTYMQKNGFNWPLLFKNTNHLGIVVPSSEFTINDVRLCVGLCPRIACKMAPRGCLTSPNSYCYICVEFVVKKQQRNIMDSVKKAYYAYFGVKLGDQDKDWAPHIVCSICVEELRQWTKGSRRMLDVMDVNTQKNVEMTMKDWQRYYESQDKDKLLNVISLEFSHTKLEGLVEAPTVVRQIDWVEKVWPRHLKEAQTESTNVLEDMMYPKVQKYCLMSVSGCYTDFHIDFGGTSVWYHILKGKKIFWLIPPSERNLQLYEQWVLSGKQSDIFFGDTVEKCARVELQAGNTFFIPTGWIHAVYTPEDSLVFGGNFLHSFGIEKQLRVAHVEDTTHVPQKFRYPFFTEMLWYLLERYVHVLLGRTHLTLPTEEQEKYDRAKSKMNNNKKIEHVHLTQYELHGMKAIVMYLHSLPTSKKFVPELIKDPIALIRDVRTVVEEHRYDSPEFAATNQPVLEWWDREPVKYTVKRSVCDPTIYIKKRRQSGEEPRSSVVKLPPNVAKIRHRRIRCKECEPCTRGDCQQCVFCRDMVKYGGGGTMKQTCKLKKCVQPVLPATASCYICHLDGWMRPVGSISSKPPNTGPSNLMECIICFKISHPLCLENKFKGIESTVNEDLPNSWECAECIQLGYNKEYKHNRTPSSRISSGGSDTAKSPLALSENEDNKTQVKVELKPNEQNLLEDVKPTVNGTPGVRPENSSTSDPPTLRMPTWKQLEERLSYPLVRPSWVIRPAPPPPISDQTEESGSDDDVEGDVKNKPLSPPIMKKEIMLNIFSKLGRNDLLVALRVCTQWSKWAVDPSLWKKLSLAHDSVDAVKLHGIIRRQPSELILDWSDISYDQFFWLICRLPQLQSLHCEGLSWGVIRSLVTPYCPPLSELNISFCEGVDDETLTAILRPPPFNRPGFRDTSSRLRQLEHLWLAGTQVGDTSVSLIVRSLPFLTHLDLSGCLRITDFSTEYLAHSTSLVCHSLKSLDLRGCHHLSPLVLPFIARLPILSYLALDPCDFIPLKAIKVWGATHGYTFDNENIMRRVPQVKDPSTVDGTSDYELEVGQGRKMSVSIGENPKTPENNVSLKGETNIDRENLSVHENCAKNKSNDINTKSIDSTKSNKKKSDTKETDEINKKDKVLKYPKEFEKKEAPQLKCVLTPLEKSCKSTTKVAHIELKGESASIKEKNSYKSEKIVSPLEDISLLEDKPYSSCRRSERRNKGTKYKFNFVKKKVGKEKLKPKCSFKEDKKPLLKNEDETIKKLEKSSPLKSPKRHINKTMKADMKRKTRKNIITRSKKLKEEIMEIYPKPEYEVVQRPFLKGTKEGNKPLKDEEVQCNKSNENEDSLKVRIALKSATQYSSKLRKKSRDDESSSPSSSPDSKRNVSGGSREETKPHQKRQEESSSFPKKLKDQKESQPSVNSVPSSFLKKRKDRTGSSSSSSSSSSPSSSPCLPLSKKLKVELKPISKIGRRRSDVVNLGNNGKGEPSGVTSVSSSATVTEKTSRPERHHRSPRRLSMCQ